MTKKIDIYKMSRKELKERYYKLQERSNKLDDEINAIRIIRYSDPFCFNIVIKEVKNMIDDIRYNNIPYTLKYYRLTKEQIDLFKTYFDITMETEC